MPRCRPYLGQMYRPKFPFYVSPGQKWLMVCWTDGPCCDSLISPVKNVTLNRWYALMLAPASHHCNRGALCLFTTNCFTSCCKAEVHFFWKKSFSLYNYNTWSSCFRRKKTKHGTASLSLRFSFYTFFPSGHSQMLELLWAPLTIGPHGRPEDYKLVTVDFRRVSRWILRTAMF